MTESIGQPEAVQQDPIVTCPVEHTEAHFVSIEAVSLDACGSYQKNEQNIQSDLSITITSVPTAIQEGSSSESLEEETEGDADEEVGITKCDEVSVI